MGDLSMNKVGCDLQSSFLRKNVVKYDGASEDNDAPLENSKKSG